MVFRFYIVTLIPSVLSHTHTHTHTQIYIYIYLIDLVLRCIIPYTDGFIKQNTPVLLSSATAIKADRLLNVWHHLAIKIWGSSLLTFLISCQSPSIRDHPSTWIKDCISCDNIHYNLSCILLDSILQAFRDFLCLGSGTNVTDVNFWPNSGAEYSAERFEHICHYTLLIHTYLPLHTDNSHISVITHHCWFTHICHYTPMIHTYLL